MRRPKIRKLLFALFTFTTALGFYAFLVEPSWLEITHHEIQGPLDTSLKVAHITDLHLDGIGKVEKILLNALEKERPDLICITGDSVDSPSGYKTAKTLFSQLHAPLGVWLVRGNWENWIPIGHEMEFYRSAGVHFLLNRSEQIRKDLRILGLDDESSGQPDRALAEHFEKKGFCIALFHSPVSFEKIAGRCNLSLSGHTHGGQVKIPFLGPLWLPEGSGDFVQGWYESKGSKMYVSRGIGTSILPARFLSRPELAIITITPKHES